MCCGVTLAADEVVVSDDGRQIRLNGDGTWVQLSQDRFATRTDGERVRLKPDGTWTIVRQDQADIVPATPSTPSAALDPAPALLSSDNTLYLSRVQIERRRIKRAKSIHADTRMVFHVRIVNESDTDLELRPDARNGLVVRSSRGVEYPVEALSFNETRIAPGARGDAVVVASGAPQWFGVKFLSLEVAANTFGNATPRVLSKNMNEVERKEVDSF